MLVQLSIKSINAKTMVALASQCNCLASDAKLTIGSIRTYVINAKSSFTVGRCTYEDTLSGIAKISNCEEFFPHLPSSSAVHDMYMYCSILNRMLMSNCC